MEYPQFSVLMSLYIKEKVEYFDECMKSLLRQTVLPAEIVIVFDGPLTDAMYNKVDEYSTNYPGLIKTIYSTQNEGLGLALAKGIPACSYNLIARMDTDDIAKHDRFEKQLKEFLRDEELDICGSYIDEFDNDPSHIVSHRIVPCDNDSIIKYQKHRDAFNHMTVMYKKETVLKAGNYQDCLLMEDSLLWAKMIMTGAKSLNIPEPLVLVRVGNNMYKRRGGYDYYKKYKSGKRMIYDTGFINFSEYTFDVMVQLIVSLLPNGVRGLLYKKVLHK